MMTLVEETLALTTVADESGSGSGETRFYGLLFAVKLAIGTLTTPTITLTYTGTDGVATTLLTLTGASADATYYPRHQVHSNAGAGLTLEGTQIAFDMPYVGGILAWTITSGGATKAGTLTAVLFHS
jgi:hypothetical protein